LSSNTQRRIGFIINPKSGTDRVKALQQIIDAAFKDTGCIVDIHYTEYAGHAKSIAAELAQQQYETVVAVGGDGTVNEVASGLHNTKTNLGIVPKGSGNGLARACNIPLNVHAAIEIIKKGYAKTIDSGTINNELFVSNTGVGFDAYVTQLCMNENKRGLLMYIKNSVVGFTKYKPLKYVITIDGKVYKEKAIMVSVANGNEFGYGFKIAPTASHVDGKLDIMIIKPLNFLTAGAVSFFAWRGNLHKYSKVMHLLGREINIACEDMNCHQIDGDYRNNAGELNIKIAAKSLQVIVP
jgi:diacylglycerol kinase (ATP)